MVYLIKVYFTGNSTRVWYLNKGKPLEGVNGEAVRLQVPAKVTGKGKAN